MTAKVDQPALKALKGSDEEKENDSIQVVEFVLGQEHFAIDLFDVKEVVEYTTIAKLPNVASYIRGIIDLRGEITIIVDLKQRLNIVDENENSLESSRIIVLDEHVTNSKIGILVDDVTSVSTFEGNVVDHSSDSINREDTSILGIIKRKVKVKDKERHELIIWIDIKQLLQDIDLNL